MRADFFAIVLSVINLGVHAQTLEQRQFSEFRRTAQTACIQATGKMLRIEKIDARLLSAIYDQCAFTLWRVRDKSTFEKGFEAGSALVTVPPGVNEDGIQLLFQLICHDAMIEIWPDLAR